MRDFHRTLPGYAPTPLREVPVLAHELGVGRLHVKDEAARLGLPAFKILGVSWACHQVVQRRPGVELVTATDGNHGRAVARMARRLGSPATAFVPGVMLDRTSELIESEGAHVRRVAGDYDVAVAEGAEYAELHNGIGEDVDTFTAILFQHEPPARLAVSFLLGSALSTIGLAQAGALSWSDLRAALVWAPIMVVGYAASGRLRRRLAESGMRTAVLAFCVIAACVIVIRALAA